MITEQQFYKVQAILDGKNTNKLALGKRNHANPDFPLRRIIRCAKCGVGLTGAWSKGKYAKYAYYRCGGKCTTKSIQVDKLDKAVVIMLKEITPKEESINLFIQFIYKKYHERRSMLTKLQNASDGEIERLKLLRKALVEKNLSGVYSDEIFKEQNAIIEENIMKAQIAKEDTTFDKYTIEAVTTFIKTLLADLGETYKRSNLSQIKVIMSSIFSSGVAWDYNGRLNFKISPIYQSRILSPVR